MDRFIGLVPLGGIPGIFDGHLTSVLKLAQSSMEISVGLTARLGAVVILKALTVVVYFLLMLLDLLTDFQLHTLYSLINAVLIVLLFVSYQTFFLLL